MDEKILDLAKQWTSVEFDEATKNEIQNLIDSNNEKELTDRFYKGLEFGTGGMRGILGAGTNRLNVYTVRKASQGLASYVAKLGEDAKKAGIVISYDSRIKSDLFSKEAAKVFAGNGIKAYLFESLRPLPEMSFAVRELKTTAGIMITASHNPPEYNGYKVSWSDGCQVTPPHDNGIITEVNNVANFFGAIKLADYDESIKNKMIEIIGKDVDEAYYNALKKRIINKDLVDSVADKLNIVYTSIHGAGIQLVPQALKNLGIKNLHIVKEQEKPDGNFPTVTSPNPENGEALELGIKLAKDTNSDIVLATDPDTDRLGIAVRDSKSNEFILFNGNQLGSLMVYYVLDSFKKQGKLSKDKFIAKTIVTTDLAKVIANDFGVGVNEPLTGFKYIGSFIRELENKRGTAEDFIFGYEESYGFLLGSDVRDKDAVIAVQLTVEIAAKATSEGKTLVDLLDELYLKYGYFEERLKSYTFKGFEGVEKIKNIMIGFRDNAPKEIMGKKVVEIRDVQKSVILDGDSNVIGKLDLPVSNVLMYKLEDNTKIAIRPSGTEPKIKFYYSARKKDENLAETKKEIKSYLDDLMIEVDKVVENY